MIPKRTFEPNGYLLILIFLIGILAISSSSIFTRLALGKAPSLVIAAFRLSTASLLLLPYVLIHNRQEFKQIDRKTFFLFLLAGVFLALHFSSWISSLEFTSVASSVVLVTTTPLWVALLSPIVLKEKNNPKIWIGISIAIFGSVIVSGSQTCQPVPGGFLQCAGLQDLFSSASFSGNFLALAGAWMIAGYMIVGRKLRNNFSLTFYVFFVYSVAAIVLIIVCLLAGYPFFGYAPVIYLWMLLLGIIPQLIGHSTFNWALGHLPAALVSIAFMAEPIGTVILALIFLKESPKAGEMVGGLMILLGILLVSLTNYRAKNTTV
jgi:drug/metabolite transporter (DMT)-like permease